MNAATQAVPAKKKEPMKKKTSGSSGKKLFRKVEPYIWIAPSVILMAVFILIPILSVFQMAMSDVSRAGKIKGFNGIENFVKVINNPSFSLVLKNTLVWTVAVVVLSTVLGFMLALVLNNKFRGRKIARAIVVFPWATTLVIQASAWNFIINTDYGTLNTLLLKLGEELDPHAGGLLRLGDRLRHFRHDSLCHLLRSLRPPEHRRVLL